MKKYSTLIQQDKLEGEGYGIYGTPTVYVLLPKSANVDLTEIKKLQAQIPESIKLTEDCGNYIVMVPGSYPYSYFKTILDSIK